MKSNHRLSTLKDKFYNFCFKDSVVLTKVPRRRVRLYLTLGTISFFCISLYLLMPKKDVKPPMMIEPKNVQQKKLVTLEPKPKIIIQTATSMQRMMEMDAKKIPEPVQKKEEVVVDVKASGLEKEKSKSTIQRVSKGDDALDTLYQKAISLIKQKKFMPARSIVERDDIIRHSHGKALTMLIKILLNDRSYDLIETYAKKYMDLYPSEKKDVLIAYGYALLSHQKYQELVQVFGKTVPSENQTDYYKLLGQAQLKLKNYAQAQEIYERLLQGDENNIKLLMALLIAQIALKDMDAAQITVGKLYQQPLDPKESQAIKKMTKLIVVGE